MVRLFSFVAAAALQAGLSIAQGTGFNSCDALIKAGLGESLLFPSGPGGAYNLALQSFWSGAVQDLQPWCILQPKNAQEVSKAVKALAPLSGAGHWNIAVKGGGHSHWPSNNVAQGVTIDLALLNDVTIKKESSPSGNYTHVASIGAGSNWGDALRATEAQGLGLTGGRVATVGVAGLALGGGASFHSGRRGFACDDMVNYEVVLADGKIVNANKNSNPKLFKALKGGSSNFGIVTRFDMAAFPAGDVYGGMALSTWDQKDVYIDSFLELLQTSAQNPADSQILLFSKVPDIPVPVVSTIGVNVDGDSNRTMFRNLENVPTAINTIQKWPYSELISENLSPNGQRIIWYTLTFHGIREMVTKAETLFLELLDEVNSLPYADDNMMLFSVFQPLPKHWGQFNAGGNVLGVDTSLQKDSILFLAQAFCESQEMELFFQTRLATMVAELEAYAVSKAANTPFRYLPYAHPTQDPIKSYGAKNVKFLKEVAVQYDPKGFFQTRVNGGFKLSAVQ